MLTTAGYGPPADIWSCGVCLFRMLSGGEMPFPGKTTAEVFAALRSSEADFSGPAWAHVSLLARDLLRKLLTKDARARITAQVGGHMHVDS